MTLTPHQAFELHVLKRVEHGPQWSQKFPKLKPIIDRLQDGGFVKRVPAPGSRTPLLVEITPGGLARLASLKRKAEK
jgi:DNA-binding PadR family transcriptional regulator